jgi:hypothetical protein
MPQDQNFSLELSLLPIANAQQVDRRRAIEYSKLASMVRDDSRSAHSAAQGSQIELTSQR